MGIKLSNFARAQLASPPSGTTGLAFTVAAGKGALFPALSGSDYFYGVFTNAAKTAYEIVKISARATDAFTIATASRGLDGTTAATWSTSDVFYYAMTSIAFSEVPFSVPNTAIAGVTPAADKVPYFTSGTAAAVADLSTYARTLIDDANAAAARTTLGVAIGTDVQAFNADYATKTGTETFTNKTHTNPDNTVQTLTDAATITWDTNSGAIATVTLGAAGRTMAAPTNLKKGTYVLHVLQDGTGNRTITTWNAIFKWQSGVAPALSTGASKRDIFTFICDGTNLYGSAMQDVR